MIHTNANRTKKKKMAKASQVIFKSMFHYVIQNVDLNNVPELSYGKARIIYSKPLTGRKKIGMKSLKVMSFRKKIFFLMLKSR